MKKRIKKTTSNVSGTKRITERDLILPALYLMEKNGGSITTAELNPQLEALMGPVGLDAAILANRNDSRFSQKVRNLKSHNTLEKMNVATYDYTNRKFTITNSGRSYLAGRMGKMTALLSRP